MNRSQVLKIIEQEIEVCNICRAAGWGRQVFGEGDPNARIMFVGEAPGRQEALSGRPFIGRSGKLLRKMIVQIGLAEEDVYITSPVKFFPHNKTPTKKEILHSRIHFEKQLAIINPKILVLLGKTAAAAVLGRDIAIMKDHGAIFEENGRKILVTIHPAAVLRFPKYTIVLKEDFAALRTLI